MLHQQPFLIEKAQLWPILGSNQCLSYRGPVCEGRLFWKGRCVLRIIGGQPLGLCCPEAAVSLGRDEAQSMEIIKAFSASPPPDRRRRPVRKQAGHITTPQSVQPASNSQPLQPPQITPLCILLHRHTPPPPLPNCCLSVVDFLLSVIANLPPRPSWPASIGHRNLHTPECVFAFWWQTEFSYWSHLPAAHLCDCTGWGLDAASSSESAGC